MYNHENYAQVKSEIEMRRIRAESEADARSAELRARSVEFAKIDEELALTGPNLFRAALAGEDLAPLRLRNEELNLKRKEIIRSFGLPEDYTEPHYTCNICSDTGYTKKGSVCRCLKEELMKAAIASSGIGDLIEKQSFENFELGIYSCDEKIYSMMKANLEAAKSYAENFKNSRGNLLFIGKTGTGKTHISTAIAREVIKRGFDVIYDSAQNIINDFEADRFKSGYRDTESRAEKYLECDLLILDDLGTEFITQFSISCLYNLINTRENRGLATIISTNLSSKELSVKYDDRICSRLLGKNYRALLFLGDDRRINSK